MNKGIYNIVAIVLASVVLSAGSIAAYSYITSNNATNSSKETQSNNVTPIVTALSTPNTTEEVIPSPSVTVSLTPTVTPTLVSTTVAPTAESLSKKSMSIIYDPGTQVQGMKITVEVPEDVTTLKVVSGLWSGYILRRGTKTFMAFNAPFELFEQQGYSSATPIESTISNLRRVRSKNVFESSGTYKFAVTYVLSTDLQSGTSCTASQGILNNTTSPCASPALKYKLNANESVWFSVYCSIDPVYQAICDRAMKTIVVEKL